MKLNGYYMCNVDDFQYKQRTWGTATMKKKSHPRAQLTALMFQQIAIWHNPTSPTLAKLGNTHKKEKLQKSKTIFQITV